jgi:hypothetical protein
MLVWIGIGASDVDMRFRFGFHIRSRGSIIISEKTALRALLEKRPERAQFPFGCLVELNSAMCWILSKE